MKLGVCAIKTYFHKEKTKMPDIHNSFTILFSLCGKKRTFPIICKYMSSNKSADLSTNSVMFVFWKPETEKMYLHISSIAEGQPSS